MAEENTTSQPAKNQNPVIVFLIFIIVIGLLALAFFFGLKYRQTPGGALPTPTPEVTNVPSPETTSTPEEVLITPTTKATPTPTVAPTPTPTPSPQPTATPTPVAVDFNLYWAGIYYCSSYKRAQFKITNTGAVALDSMQIKVVKIPGENWINGYTSNTPFGSVPTPSYPQCLQTGQEKLDPGGNVWHGINVTSAPDGTNAKAYIKLCTENNLGGTCLEKTIEFTI